MKSIFEKKEPGGARSLISTHCGVAIDRNMSMCGGAWSRASDRGYAAKKITGSAKPNFRSLVPPPAPLGLRGVVVVAAPSAVTIHEGDQNGQDKAKIECGLQQEGAAKGRPRTEIDHIQAACRIEAGESSGPASAC